MILPMKIDDNDGEGNNLNNKNDSGIEDEGD